METLYNIQHFFVPISDAAHKHINLRQSHVYTINDSRNLYLNDGKFSYNN